MQRHPEMRFADFYPVVVRQLLIDTKFTKNN